MVLVIHPFSTSGILRVIPQEKYNFFKKFFGPNLL